MQAKHSYAESKTKECGPLTRKKVGWEDGLVSKGSWWLGGGGSGGSGGGGGGARL